MTPTQSPQSLSRHCEHLSGVDRVCAVASQMAGAPCVASEEHCKACDLQPEPRTVNLVTTSLAIKQSPNRGKVIQSHGFVVERSVVDSIRSESGSLSLSLPIVEDCRFAMDGLCQVSTLIAEVPVPLVRSTCQACKQQDSPMAVNRITCSAARLALVKAGREIDQDISRCLAPKQTGIGTELESIIFVWQQRLGWIGLGWMLEKTQGCGCEAMKLELNSVSILEAKQYHARLVKWLHDNWQKRFPGLKVLSLVTRLGVAYALRRAVATYEKKFNQRRTCDVGR